MRLFDSSECHIDDPLLRRAYELAENGRGKVSPNPLVGCVIAQDDIIVGEGFHAGPGTPHAERVALAQAGTDAAGATAYVTLEPCNHFGNTPPCSEALITRAIAGVVVGMRDPNPVASGGVERMREAGLEVELALDSRPFEVQNEAWLHWMRTGRPFVQVKTALSLDGHASATGETRTRISGPGGRRLTMRLRNAADAVMVGAHTARVDSPALTVRDDRDALLSDQPLRIVMSQGSSLAGVGIFDDGLGPTAVIGPETTAVSKAAEPVALGPGESFSEAWDLLGKKGIVRVLVEAGPQMLTAMLSENAADEYVFVHGGGFLGKEAPPLYLKESEGNDTSAMRSSLVAHEAGIIDGDAVTVWRVPRVTDDGSKGD